MPEFLDPVFLVVSHCKTPPKSSAVPRPRQDTSRHFCPQRALPSRGPMVPCVALRRRRATSNPTVFYGPPDDKIGRRRAVSVRAAHGSVMSVLSMPRKSVTVPKSGREARLAIRGGEWNEQTAGVAPGHVQGNLAILPASLAGDFMRFCHLNPKPCPLLAASAPGDFRLPTLADDLDIRTDLPRYRVFRDGELVDEPTDIRAHWRAD